jgi:hypothetical protein
MGFKSAKGSPPIARPAIIRSPAACTRRAAPLLSLTHGLSTDRGRTTNTAPTIIRSVRCTGAACCAPTTAGDGSVD